MEQQCRAPFVAQVYVSVEVAFDFSHVVDIYVCRYRWVGLRLFHLYIYLACHRLIAVFNRTGAFRNLNGLYPRSGNVAKAERCSGSSESGHILRQHLDICSRQAEQLYLTGTCGRVAVADIDRRIGCEAFAKAAACRTFEIGCGDELGIGGCAAHLEHRMLAGNHHFVHLHNRSVGRLGSNSSHGQ